MRQSNPILLHQLQADALAMQQLGSPLLSCQGMFVPRDMPELRILFKSGPRPIVTNGDPAETHLAGGNVVITAGCPVTKYTGTLQMIVTEACHEQLFSDYLVASGGILPVCDFYDGRVDSFTAAYEMLNCAIRFEQGEWDSESKSQTQIISCPIDYNYYGNFAKIGANNTFNPAKRNVAGIDGFINRVQQVVSTAQAATSLARTATSVGRQISSLFT